MKCEICHKELATAIIDCKEVCQVCFIRLKEKLNGRSLKRVRIAQYWKEWITMAEETQPERKKNETKDSLTNPRSRNI